MTINADCYVTFIKNKEDTHVTGGVVVLIDKEEVFSNFQVYEDGQILNAMLGQLYCAMNFLFVKFEHDGDDINIFVKVAPSNTNFIQIFQKIVRGFHLVKTVPAKVSRAFILKELFTRKDYKKPKCFDAMVTTVEAWLGMNTKFNTNMIVSRDGASYLAGRTFFECRGHHNAVKPESGIRVPDPVS
jgi:hypothetical protein